MGLWRRRLVWQSGAAALSALLFGGLQAGSGQTNRRPIAMADILRDRPAARRVGQRYLAAYPQEANVTLLTDATVGTLPAMEEAALRRHIATCQRRDFATGDTVLVDGWILARSEAQICALSALEVA